jgi:hypothetical protein
MKFLSDIMHWLACQLVAFMIRIVSHIWAVFDPD